MLNCISGARAVGKKSFLVRLQKHRPWARVFDLNDFGSDALPSLIATLEKESVREAWIIVDPGTSVPAHIPILWLRRDDLPDLLPCPWTRASVLTLRTGSSEALNKIEEQWIDATLPPQPGRLLLEPWHVLKGTEWFGSQRVLARSDMLGEEGLQRVMEQVPPHQAWVSYRSGVRLTRAIEPRGIAWEWDLALGACPFETPPGLCLSTRRMGQTLQDCLHELDYEDRHLRLEVPILSFRELAAGHVWQELDPERRIFSPRTAEALPRWKWYHLLQREAVFRDGAQSDFPSTLEWAAVPKDFDSFAAVLGDPVQHSFTPLEQEEFFSSRKMPVLAVPVPPAEWRDAMDFLHALGLRAAAVTSPLKSLAFTICSRKSEAASRLGAVNTLVRVSDEWRGTNTDVDGLRSLLQGEDLGQPDWVVWGGGGTRGPLEELLPRASYYAARSRRLDHGPGCPAPRALVWAAGGLEGAEPFEEWSPLVVYDLNYRSDSGGRTYASKIGAAYVSGISMFQRQAAEQRCFWERHL